MDRKLLIGLLGTAGACFLLFPGVVGQGAKAGLELWFFTVLPALLPFMILSSFMIRQNITDYVSAFVYPLFHRLFGLSFAGCYPAVAGLISGYPVGAKTAAGLYLEKKISKREAQYLLSFCNNASPMFLLQYIGVQCLGLGVPAAVPAIIYLSGFLNSVLWRKRLPAQKKERVYRKEPEISGDIISALDESILDSFLTITKIGGYIVLFSILAKIIDALLPISVIIKSVGIGVLEITIGVMLVNGLALGQGVRFIIMASLCAFGGLSSVAQTASVIHEADLSTGGYVLSKLTQAGIAAALAAVWVFWAGIDS